MDNRWILSSRYQVGEIIGYGGMAAIHRGVDLIRNEEVALKILKEEYATDAEMVGRFINEARAMMELNHPHIVRVYGVDVDRGIHYIAMELVRGSTLKELIQKWGRIPVSDAVQWGMDICDALRYAHEKRIIHRDIKPENILVDRNGVAKITDFGIAKVLDGVSVTKMDGDVLGSVQYIAPEQARGEDTDEKTDIYSLGATLYEMLTGQVPFTGDTSVAIAMKHIRSVGVPPINLEPAGPYSLSSVVVKALAKNPANRYASMRLFYQDLYRSTLEPDGTFADTVDHSIEVLDDKPVDPRKSIKDISKICAIVMAALVAFFLLGKALIESGRGTQVAVPQVVGLYVDLATSALTKAGLGYEIQRVHGEASEGTVLDSSPREGEMVESKTKVILTVCDGPEKVQVPQVVGLSLEEALVELERNDLEVGTVEYRPQSNEPTGKVISQSPTGEQQVQAGTFVNLAVDGYNPDKVAHTTPVLGKTLEEARNLLRADGYTNIVVCEEESSAENRGLVLRQNPGGGTYGVKENLCILYVGAYRTRPVSGRVKVTAEVSEADSKVVITLVEEESEFVMAEGTYGAGGHSMDVTVRSTSAGRKTLRIYCNGVWLGQSEVEI